MAQVEKRTHSNGKVTYRARVRVQGMPNFSAIFPTRIRAKEWGR